MSSNKWDLNQFFPNKVCINLERRSDRWQRMQARLAHHGIDQVAQFRALDGLNITVPPSWDDFPGSYACLLSHLAVVENAHQNRWQSVLIIEDDVVFHPDLNRLFRVYVEQMPDDWDMLYFGALHGETPVPVADNIVKLTHSLSTYAYALRRRMYDAFIDLNRQALTVLDENTRALQKQFNCYCFMPHLAWVEEDFSDVREERSNIWWLSESLVLWGEDVDRIEAQTAVVISYRGNSEAAQNNLQFIVDYYSKQLPHIFVAVIEQGTHQTIDKTHLPANCDLLFLQSTGRHDRGRAFNHGFELFSSRKDFFIFLDSDVFLTREDIRANLLRCRDHDFATACSAIWDLNQPDTLRILNNDLRWNYNGNYQPHEKSELCESACFVTTRGMKLTGGWRENDNHASRYTSEQVRRSLNIYQSPNPARRLFNTE